MQMLLRAYGVTGTALAVALGCSYPTALKKRNNPSLLTLGDLARISNRLSIPIDDIRGAIRV